MGELRRNIVTGSWVVVAPARGNRPMEVGEAEDSDRPPFDPGCPFCPGNEGKLAKLLWELPDAQGGWHTRAVSNLYPAFQAGALPVPFPQEERRPLPAAGRQEVLIETPRHDLDPSRLAPVSIRALIEGYHRRYVHLSGLPGIEQVFLFRNHGRQAGISLVHPHSQFVATAFTPPMLAERGERLRQFHRETSECLFCGIHRAWRDGPEGERRRVAENRSFVALVPWAAESPFEVWVVPRRHQADFSELTEEERDDLAALLGQLLRVYRDAAGDPPYNYMVQAWGPQEVGRPELHWFLRILPRGVRRAGFEIGSGVSINPSSPEADAAILRQGMEAEHDEEKSRTDPHEDPGLRTDGPRDG